jgi:hypothetical protein
MGLHWHLISQAKTSLSALALKRQLWLSCPTAWLMHHKLLRATALRDNVQRLDGEVQLDDAYLGGERVGGKRGRSRENKVKFLAAVSVNDEGYQFHTKLMPVGRVSRPMRSAPGPSKIWLRRPR